MPFFSQTTPNKCSPSDCVCFDFQIVWFRSSNKGCPLLCLSFHFRMCAPKFVACKYSIINYCVNFPIDVIFSLLKLCPISPWLHSWGVISIDWEKNRNEKQSNDRFYISRMDRSRFHFFVSIGPLNYYP